MSRGNLLFVINSIGSGGAERVLVNVIEAQDSQRFPYVLHLAVLDRMPDMRQIPPHVVVHRLDARGSLLRSIVQLRRLARDLRPVAMIALLVRANVAAALVGRLFGIPTLACERMHISSHLAGKHGGWRLWAARALARLSYRCATAVAGVSQGVTDDLVANFGASPARTRTINNPYDLDAIRRAGCEAPELAGLPPRFAVAVARLEPSKNLAFLIDAWLKAPTALPLLILGDGAQKDALLAHAARRGAGDRIRFAGYLKNPFAVVARAEFSVSASLNEGFPNAMAEAMVLGIPVLASDCPSGPAALLGSPALSRGRATLAPHGVIVPMNDEAALIDGIERLGSETLRARYAAQAELRSRDFASARIATAYWRLFDALARRAPLPENLPGTA